MITLIHRLPDCLGGATKIDLTDEAIEILDVVARRPPLPWTEGGADPAISEYLPLRVTREDDAVVIVESHESLLECQLWIYAEVL